MPVSYRVIDKAEGKAKNALFREMVAEVLAWGLAQGWSARTAGSRA